MLSAKIPSTILIEMKAVAEAYLGGLVSQDRRDHPHPSSRNLLERLGSHTPRRSISVPHVAEAAFSMECTVEHWYDLKNDAGQTNYTVILGRVRRFQAVRGQSCASCDTWSVQLEQTPLTRLG